MRLGSSARIYCRIILLGAMALFPQTVWADAPPQDRAVGWTDWNFDPVILINLSLVMWLYSRGFLQMRHAAEGGQHPSCDSMVRETLGPTASVRPRKPFSPLAFAVGFGVLTFSLLSPIDAMGKQLSWAHMIQHMLIMTVAVPLLILGSSGLICLRGIPTFSRRWAGQAIRQVDRRLGRWMWNAGLAWPFYAIATWAWHVPSLYGAALRSSIAHDLQHLSFFVAAWLFWRPLLNFQVRRSLPGGLAVFYLLTTTLHTTVLGVLMTMAPVAWYREYADTTLLWGWSPLEDQQMAGLIMWMPACLPYLVAAVWLFAHSIRPPATRALECNRSSPPSPALQRAHVGPA